MQQTLLLLPILVPVLFWGLYHYHKDRHLPEPVANLLLCFIMGVGSAFLAKLFYAGLEPIGLRYDAMALAENNTLGLLSYALMAIGPIEESAKLIPFLLIVMRFKALDEPMDGIIYASFIGLGYAAMENVNYLAYLTPLEAAARGFASPVVHILFASIWAYWISRARLQGSPIFVPALFGFVASALLHGIYDFLVLMQPVSALPLAALIIVILWVWRLKLLQQMHRDATDRRRV